MVAAAAGWAMIKIRQISTNNLILFLSANYAPLLGKFHLGPCYFVLLLAKLFNSTP
jgi:hypothetical protein